MEKFEGSEKQVKWANDIVDKAKTAFENEIKEMESDHNINLELLENRKNLTDIITGVLSKLSSVWSAGDVIENRSGLEGGKLETFGIRSFGGGRKIKVGDKSYEGSDLKDVKVKKEIENYVLEHLKSYKK